jgi:hypothetical protein
MPRKRPAPAADTPSERPRPLLVDTRATPRQATAAVAFTQPVFDDDDPLLDFLPYIHTTPRRNSITPDVQRAFIRELAATGTVKAAARRVGKSLEALYKLRARPGAAGFARAWDEALAWGVLRLEDCAMERALHDGAYNPRANAMLCFVIKHRNHHMVDSRQVKPGHWLYERIRYELTGEWGDEEGNDLA